MIVKPTETGWEVIYHRAHAQLAAQLAGQWRRCNAPPRLYETLAAISHHDDLEREWEGNHLTPAGTPMDFTLCQTTDLSKLRELTENARYRGRWVALLISMHMSKLNGGKRGESPEMDEFLDVQQQHQQAWRQQLGIAQAEADAAYAFMQWCDRFSLILCQHELPADQRALEISQGPDGQRYDLREREDGLVTVTPWPFEDDKFTVNVEACTLDQVTFPDNDALTQALRQAPIKVLDWTFIKEEDG